MNKENIKNIFARYLTGTLGLVLVAIGVALSIKSDLGTAPISCPPYVVSMCGNFELGGFTIGTVGQYTMLMHLIFILLQMALLRSRFRLENLMQIPAAIVFGLLTDLSIAAFGWIEAGTYGMKIILMCLSIVITALGISLEPGSGRQGLDAGGRDDGSGGRRFFQCQIQKRQDILRRIPGSDCSSHRVVLLRQCPGQRFRKRDPRGNHHVGPAHRRMYEIHRQTHKTDSAGETFSETEIIIS
mgnify:CR=1 FL=1